MKNPFHEDALTLDDLEVGMRINFRFTESTPEPHHPQPRAEWSWREPKSYCNGDDYEVTRIDEKYFTVSHCVICTWCPYDLVFYGVKPDAEGVWHDTGYITRVPAVTPAAS